jgi:hypothetical protein
MTSIAPRGVGIWGSSLHGAARAEWSATVPPNAYNANRLQGRNRNRVPSGRAPIGPLAPSASIPSGVPSARASWSQPIPPDRYNVGRLTGRNTKRVPDSYPRTLATVAAVLQGPTPTGLVSNAGGPVRPANVAEVMAGLRAALESASNDDERENIKDLMEQLRPIAAIAARRALAPDEQAVVNKVAQEVLGEAEREVAEQAGEEREHQAARAAEFAGIEEQKAANVAAENEGEEAGRHAAKISEEADTLERELVEARKGRRRALAYAAEQKEREERASIEAENALRIAHDIEQEQERLADDLRQGAADHKAAKRDVIQLSLDARALTKGHRGVPVTARKKEEAARMIRTAAELRERIASNEQAAAEVGARLALLQSEKEELITRGRFLSGEARTAEAQGRDAVALAQRIADDAPAAAERLQRLKDEATEATDIAVGAQFAALMQDEPGAPKLPEKAPRTRRRKKAAGAKAEENARAVAVIREALSPLQATAAEALGKVGRPPPEEERKSSAQGLPREITKTGIWGVLNALGMKRIAGVKAPGTSIDDAMVIMEAKAPGALAAMVDAVSRGVPVSQIIAEARSQRR